jgi:hypothetical protein
MLGIILRLLIVIAVFLAGALAGNILMPKKQIEHTSIVNIGEPETSLNLEREFNIDAALNTVTQTEAELANAAIDRKTLPSWKDTMRRALLLQSYKAAKANYELELLKIQNPSYNRDGFAKTRDNYLKIKKQIETTFPPRQLEDMELLPIPADTSNPTAQMQTTQTNGESGDKK